MTRTAHIEGTLNAQPVAVDVPLYKQPFANADVTVDDMVFRVEGIGGIANEMAATTEGELVVIDGDLLIRRWKTAGNNEREKWVIRATTWHRPRKISLNA